MDAGIVGLMEIEDDGYGPDSAIQELVDELNVVAGAGTYDELREKNERFRAMARSASRSVACRAMVSTRRPLCSRMSSTCSGPPTATSRR